MILEPYRLTDEAFVIPAHWQPHGAPMGVSLNSMVLRSAQPVLFDTSVGILGAEWLDAVGRVVDLDDVRWIVLSHDDADHVGNLDLAMRACPNATAVTNWFMAHRIDPDHDLPPHRQRWVGHGEQLDIGDRVLQFMRPPLFDSPTTRAVFDPRSRVMWASDVFATPVTAPTMHVDELDPAFYEMGFTQFQQWNSPWFELVDPTRFTECVDRFAAFAPTTIASCHGPALTGSHIDRAFALLRDIPHAPFTPMPGQGLLDEMVTMAAAA
jgi:flavorubredoxin